MSRWNAKRTTAAVIGAVVLSPVLFAANAAAQTAPFYMFFEVYDNEAALTAHQATDHFMTYDATTKTMVSKRVTTPLSSVVVQIK
jgi:hypothetical protein